MRPGAQTVLAWFLFGLTLMGVFLYGYLPAGTSDAWEGLDAFFEPGREVLVTRSAADTTAALDLSDRELREIGEAGRERALSEHTSDRRAATLEAEIEAARSRAGPAQALPMEG